MLGPGLTIRLRPPFLGSEHLEAQGRVGMSSLLPADPGGLGAFAFAVWRERAKAPLPFRRARGKVWDLGEGQTPWRAAARGPQFTPVAQQVERSFSRAGFWGTWSPRPTKGAPLPALTLKPMFYSCELSSSA